MRKRFKKILSLALTAAMTASLFAGTASASQVRRLFDEKEKAPRLIVTNDSWHLVNGEGYWDTYVKLASDANAAIASDSNAIIYTSPSDALNALELVGDQIYLSAEDVIPSSSDATQKVTVNLEADGKEFQGDVTLVRNWFEDSFITVDPSRNSDINLTRAWYYRDKLTPLKDCTLVLKENGTEVTDSKIVIKKIAENESSNTVLLNFQQADRTMEHSYVLEIYKGNDLLGYCRLQVLQAPVMTVNGMTVTQGEGLKAYLGNMSDSQKSSVTTLEISGGNLLNEDLESVKDHLPNLKRLIIDETVRYPDDGIPNSCFKNMKSLEEVTINAPAKTRSAYNDYEGTNVIYGNAFEGCTSLKNVSIPNVTYLYYEAFKGCSSLESIEMPDVTTLSTSVFENCTSLKQIRMPKVESLRLKVFKNCSSLEKVEMPSVYEFYNEDEQFSGCKNLKEITIREYRIWAESANSFKDVPLPLSYVIVGSDGKPLTGYRLEAAKREYAVSDLWRRVLGLEYSQPSQDMTIWYTLRGSASRPATVKSMNDFYEVLEHAGVSFDDVLALNLTEGTWTESDWKELEKLTNLVELEFSHSGITFDGPIPSDLKLADSLIGFAAAVKKIPERMFEGHKALKYVYLYDVTEIGSRAFAGCDIYELRVPKTPPVLGDDVFAGCTPHDALMVPDGDRENYRFGQWLIWLGTGKPPVTPPATSGGGHSTRSAGAGYTAKPGQWLQNEKGWWYQYAEGMYPTSQWVKLNWNGTDCWYYFDADGYMATGWLTDGGYRYYLYPIADGRRGYMYTGWNEIDGKWYYFSTGSTGPEGSLLTDSVTPDGYRVDENGVWVK